MGHTGPVTGLLYLHFYKYCISNKELHEESDTEEKVGLVLLPVRKENTNKEIDDIEYVVIITRTILLF